MTGSLTDLPQELLDLIPVHLANIEDLLSLSATCRKFHEGCSTVPPQVILRLAAAQSTTFFRPHPHFLIAATASQLPAQVFDGTLSSEKLRNALQGGVDGLFDLCVARCGITMAEIRELYELRFSLINPLTDWIDKLAGKQWYATPNFWDGGVSDAGTIDAEPERALFQVAIYGELFGTSVENYIRSGGRSAHILEREVRMDYVKYCVPDWICAGGYPGLEVLNTGPYKTGRLEKHAEDQLALNHILSCRRWCEAWAAVRAVAGKDFGELDDPEEIKDPQGIPWRQNIWENVALTQGLRGFTMLRPGGMTETQRKKLVELRECVERLDISAKPAALQVPVRRPWYTLDFPLPDHEILICILKYWPGTHAHGW